MFARGRYVGAACLAALAIAGAAGCSGSGDRPQPLPPLSTTPAATSSPEPTNDRASELAAATAVVREYFRLKNAIGTTMDPTSLEGLETANCTCRKFANSVRATRAQQQRYFGRVLHLAMTPAINGPRSVTVLVSYDTTAGGTKDQTGRILFKGPARSDVAAVFTLIRVHTSWLIDDIANVRPGVKQS